MRSTFLCCNLTVKSWGGAPASPWLRPCCSLLMHPRTAFLNCWICQDKQLLSEGNKDKEMCIQYLNAGSLCKIIQACCFSTRNVALDTDLVKKRATLRPTLWQSSEQCLKNAPCPFQHASSLRWEEIISWEGSGDPFGRCDSLRPPLFPSLANINQLSLPGKGQPSLLVPPQPAASPCPASSFLPLPRAPGVPDGHLLLLTLPQPQRLNFQLQINAS